MEILRLKIDRLPHEFALFIIRLRSDWLVQRNQKLYFDYDDFTPNTTVSTTQFYVRFGVPDMEGVVTLLVKKAPDDCADLSVEVTEENRILAEKGWRILKRELERAQLISKVPPVKRNRSQINAKTRETIKQIASYRQEMIDQRRSIPSRSETCITFNSDQRTLKRHAPNLYKSWGNPGYAWDESELPEDDF